MFSRGQLIFGGLFALVFIAILIYAYRKDLKLHKRYYKGTIWILLAFVSFLALMFLVKLFVN